MKKILYSLLALLVILIIIYLAGPRPETPEYNVNLPEVPPIRNIENYVQQKEAKHKLRKDNNALIVWADSAQQATKYVILYIHGFSASRMEGNPVHRNVADHFGANLYLARVAGHGLDTANALLGFTADAAWESVKEALMIAHTLGDKVIIVSTSTGSPLAMKLAAEYPEKVHALINLSPNIRIKNSAARLLNDPWGKQIASMTFGENRVIKHKQPDAPKYWDTIYRVEAMVELEQLVETTMTDDVFKKITCPVLTLYYYKDEENQDQVVDVSVIPETHEALGTPADKKKYIALSTPGDHVIGSFVKSKDYKVVEEEIIKFCNEVLGMGN